MMMVEGGMKLARAPLFQNALRAMHVHLYLKGNARSCVFDCTNEMCSSWLRESYSSSLNLFQLSYVHINNTSMIAHNTLMLLHSTPMTDLAARKS